MLACQGDAGCTGDFECTAGLAGRCVPRAVGRLCYTCSYDECADDTKCPAKTPCRCREGAPSTSANACAKGSECRVDTDCDPCGYCSPSVVGICGRGNSWYCHNKDDECVNDADCIGGIPCNFDVQAKHWRCFTACSPPPP